MIEIIEKHFGNFLQTVIMILGFPIILLIALFDMNMKVIKEYLKEIIKIWR